MSSNPSTVAEADWTRFGWEAQQAELRSIAGHQSNHGPQDHGSVAGG
jgi:hypothetical protein